MLVIGQKMQMQRTVDQHNQAGQWVCKRLVVDGVVNDGKTGFQAGRCGELASALSLCAPLSIVDANARCCISFHAGARLIVPVGQS